MNDYSITGILTMLKGTLLSNQSLGAGRTMLPYDCPSKGPYQPKPTILTPLSSPDAHQMVGTPRNVDIQPTDRSTRWYAD